MLVSHPCSVTLGSYSNGPGVSSTPVSFDCESPGLVIALLSFSTRASWPMKPRCPSADFLLIDRAACLARDSTVCIS